MFSVDTLKASHASTKTEFMCWGKNILSHTSESKQPLPHCRETSVFHLGHYHWYGNWLIRILSVQRVGVFGTSFILGRHCQSECHVHQRKVSYFWQGRRRIHWIIGSWIQATCIYPSTQMVCDVLSSTVLCWSIDLGITPWVGVKWWLAWSISHQIGRRQVTCNIMVLALQFALSTFVHLEITCNYRWPYSTFCWDQIQLHRSYIPERILVGYDWGQKGWSFFQKRLIVIIIITWFFEFFIYFFGLFVFWHAC